MGGLKKYMPWTWGTMWVATLAISGVPLFAGFFSKDEILWRAWESGATWVWVLGVVTAGMTAFYMFRLMLLTFHGSYRGGAKDPEHGQVQGGHGAHGHDAGHGHGHEGHGHEPHESPWSMVGPLVVLAFFSVVAGYVMVPHWFPIGSQWLEHFLEPVFEHRAVLEGAGGEHHGVGLEILLTAVSVLVAAAGMGLAWYCYILRPEIPGQVAARVSGVYRTLYNKYWVDELYDALIINRTKDLGNLLSSFDAYIVDGMVNLTAALTRGTATVSRIFDTYVVDGLVNLTGATVQFFSRVFRQMQTGLVQGYALFILAGVLAFLSLYLYMGA
jgi:NADH-quinone oxidoreductase subunit L